MRRGPIYRAGGRLVTAFACGGEDDQSMSGATLDRPGLEYTQQTGLELSSTEHMAPQRSPFTTDFSIPPPTLRNPFQCFNVIHKTLPWSSSAFA
jgi:hypothetical protein